MSSTFISFALRPLLTVVLISLSAGCSGDRRIHKLFKAIDAGDASTVDAVLDDETFDLKSTQDSGAQYLFHAMAARNKAIYVKLLEKGASPNRCDSSGKCIMNQSAEEEDSYWLSEALAHGGDPDVLNTGNRHVPNSTPLFYAIYKRRVENTKILIDASADLNHRNSFGLAPLREAAGNGKYESVVALLEAGADPSQADKHGHSLVDWFKGRDETLVPDSDQIKWFHKAREILIDRGFIKTGSE